MLNISPNTIRQQKKIVEFKSFSQTGIVRGRVQFTRWMIALLIIFLVFLFLPWTQNIQSNGKITTLRPEQRPQTIHSTIAGRVEKWYVQEGEKVKKGDTIVYLSEIKVDYFDPELINRTTQQVDAKEGSIDSYNQKIKALDDQMAAMRAELSFKQEQLGNKIKQIHYKIASDSAELKQLEIDFQIATRQLERTQTLVDKGIKAVTDLEDKRQKFQKINAKKIAIVNKLGQNQNELANAELELSTVAYNYNQKIAKAQSDKFSTISTRLDVEANVNKLKIQRSSYEQRSKFYYIIAPQDAFITKALTSGIGETVKEGAPVVSIMPANYTLAVELEINPMDLPLVAVGREVRFLFDGWPALVFSGWPGLSYGTFKGKVFAIDNTINDKGKYRILIAPDEEEKPWPEALRPGSGAKGIALLKNVPLWYELWRQLNGFPPDYYKGEIEKLPKLKAPVKNLK
ncbi:MAG: HlyD family secretion protein [Saprospiraceae bacterium]|jgi:multidrug resistance efflux pump|nr:HlyD family secretion protein [Saprospiraceae bacterium]